TGFLGAINTGVLGAWTGTVTYDVDAVNIASSEDILATDGTGTLASAGKRYAGGFTSLGVQLDDGTDLSAWSAGQVEVLDGSFPGLGPDHTLSATHSIPVDRLFTSTPSEYVQ